eukprot:gene58-62_t
MMTELVTRDFLAGFLTRVVSFLQLSMKSNTMTSQAREPNPMLGSVHVYSDGYGYGARYPTSRNTMTLPANVPKQRRPPDTDRFLKGIRSTQRVKMDEGAMKKHAEQIAMLTSGEIGLHYLGRESSAVRLNMKPIDPPPEKKKEAPANLPSSQSVLDQTSNASQTGWMSNRSNFSDGGYSHRSHSLASFREGLSESQNKYTYTLNNLDSTFGRNAKKDLITASLPPRPAQELVWCATTIQHNALQSKGWSLKLRKDSNN